MNQLNYQYALVSNGQVLDTTDLDEDDQAQAEWLLLDAYGWQDKVPAGKDLEVRLLNVLDNQAEM